jgi:hypothetical protein
MAALEAKNICKHRTNSFPLFAKCKRAMAPIILGALAVELSEAVLNESANSQFLEQLIGNDSNLCLLIKLHAVKIQDITYIHC